MAKLTRKRKAALDKFDVDSAYSLDEAAGIVKEISSTTFDSSVDLAVSLGVDPRKANQMVRGTVSLPHGSGKNVRVLVLCNPDKEARPRRLERTTLVSMSMSRRSKADGPMWM